MLNMFSRNFLVSLGHNLNKFLQTRTIFKCKVAECPKPKLPLNVAIIGANGNVGKISALLLKTNPMFKEIILYDWKDISDVICDLQYINTTPKLIGYSGWKNLKDAIQDARIVYICEGVQTEPGMSEKCLFAKNAHSVRQIFMYCSEFNPKAMIVVATPPISSFVAMGNEEFKKGRTCGEKKIFGLAKTYISRANSIVGRELKIDPSKVNCQVVGGTHRRTCIPVLSQIQHVSNMKRATNEKLTRSIQEAEEDNLYEKAKIDNKKGCFLLTAYAGVELVTSLANAYNGKKDIVECAFVKQEPPIDQYARYLTSPVKIGEEGILSRHLPKLSALEKSRLKLVADDMIDSISMGECYTTGEDRMTVKHRPKIEKPKKIAVCLLEEKSTKEEQCKKIEPPKTMKITV